MVDRLVAQKLTGSVRNSIWGVDSAIAHTEKDAILDLDPRHPAMWHFINPSHHGAVGYPSGYEIMAGATAVSIVSPEDPSQMRGAFPDHHIRFPPYHPNNPYPPRPSAPTTN